MTLLLNLRGMYKNNKGEIYEKTFVKIGLLLAVFGLLVGCDNSSAVVPPSSASEEVVSSSEEEVKLTEQEYQIAVNYIVRSVPLVLERGVKVPTNVERLKRRTHYRHQN